MYKQHTYAKIADYRGARRVWLEGLRLAACGFDKGAAYNIVYNVGNGSIKLILAENGARTVSGRKKGDGYTPIVDICNADLVKVTGAAQRVRVDFEAGAITISIHHHDAKQAARETDFLNHVNGGGLTEGSLCAGIGVATAAIHHGLTEGGLSSSVSWIVDRERKYLQVAADNNTAIDENTVLFEATLEELEPELLTPVDMVQVSLPCTGHSIAGKSKNKIKTAEEHATDATATHETERGARDHLIAVICNNSAQQVAEFYGDIEKAKIMPVECYEGGDPKHVFFKEDINTPDELTALCAEFKGALVFAGDTEKSHAFKLTGGKYKSLLRERADEIQHSTPEYSLIIPECGEAVPVDGGQWLPALVFVSDGIGS